MSNSKTLWCDWGWDFTLKQWVVTSLRLEMLVILPASIKTRLRILVSGILWPWLGLFMDISKWTQWSAVFTRSKSNKYNDLRGLLEKLQLNDASLQFETWDSQALGFGFPLWFLGSPSHGCYPRTFGARITLTWSWHRQLSTRSIWQMEKSLDVVQPSEFPDPTKIGDWRTIC